MSDKGRPREQRIPSSFFHKSRNSFSSKRVLDRWSSLLRKSLKRTSFAERDRSFSCGMLDQPVRGGCNSQKFVRIRIIRLMSNFSGSGSLPSIGRSWFNWSLFKTLLSTSFWISSGFVLRKLTSLEGKGLKCFSSWIFTAFVPPSTRSLYNLPTFVVVVEVELAERDDFSAMLEEKISLFRI